MRKSEVVSDIFNVGSVFECHVLLRNKTATVSHKKDCKNFATGKKTGFIN